MRRNSEDREYQDKASAVGNEEGEVWEMIMGSMVCLVSMSILSILVFIELTIYSLH